MFSGIAVRASLAVMLVSAVVRAEPVRDSLGDPLPEGAIARFGVPPERCDRWFVAFSADNRTVFRLNNTILLAWDTRTGARTWSRRLAPAGFLAGGLSCDGSRALFLNGKELRVVETQTGAILRSLDFPAACGSLSADGNWMAGGTSDRVYGAWSIATGERVFSGAPVEDNSGGGTPWIALSANGQVAFWGGSPTTNLVSAMPGGREVRRSGNSADRALRLLPGGEFAVERRNEDWTVVTLPSLGEVARFDGDAERIVAISADGRRVYCVGYESLAEHDLEAGKTGWQLENHGFFRSEFALSSDGQSLAAATWDDRLLLVNLTSRALTQMPAVCGSQVMGLSFSPDGERLAIADYRGMSMIANVESGEIRGVQSDREYDFGEWVAWSPDGKTVAWGFGNRVRLQDAETGVFRPDPGISFGWGGATWSPDSKRLGLASWPSMLKVVDVASCADVTSVKEPAGVAMAWSPDGSIMATDTPNRCAALWNASTGEKLRELRFHVDDLSSLAFSPDGLLVVTASFDYTARVWEAATGKAVLTFRGHSRGVIGARFTPDGRYLHTASLDGTARVVELATGREVAAFATGRKSARSCAFSTDGRRIALGDDNGQATVFDAKAVLKRRSK